MKNAMEDGYIFYISDNEVILTETPIPFKYLKIID
jgi:RNA:NAD 2'-phosphotransferase (TPT1/KptA family)